MAQVEVGVLGATGAVGQMFVRLLEHHPDFKLTWLAASDRSAGKRYAETAPWRLSDTRPANAADLVVTTPTPGSGPKLVFSALDASVAEQIEGDFAKAGHVVVSNARNFRMHPAVPLLVPEVNADHLALNAVQAAHWKGLIVTNPNCSTVFLAMALAPLRQFGLTKVMVTTMQAVSGAGYPGVASLDILGNVVPFIGGEEEKVESEPQRILGKLIQFKAGAPAMVEPHPCVISATTTRVSVIDGHTESISVELTEKVTAEDLKQAWVGFRGKPQEYKLRSAPAQPIVYLEESNRPQPRLDVDRDGGMTVSIGRLRQCPILGYKFVALGHNTIRGAAGAAILNAELMQAEGLL